jgi:hypothetical protein
MPWERISAGHLWPSPNRQPDNAGSASWVSATAVSVSALDVGVMLGVNEAVGEARGV